MNDLIPFKELPPGAVFYLDLYYGNSYRKVDHKTSEFVTHRAHNEYVGIRLQMSPAQAVRRMAIAPEELELDGIDPKAEPFSQPWVRPAGYDLLGDILALQRKPASSPEDLLGTLPPTRRRPSAYDLL